MSYRLACEAADVFVAAAGQAGTLGVDACDPADADLLPPHPRRRGHEHPDRRRSRPRDLRGRVPIAARQRAPARRGRRVPGRPGHDDRGTGDHRDVGTVRRRHRDRVRDRRGRDPCVDGRRAGTGRRTGAVRRVRQQRGRLGVSRRPPAHLIATARAPRRRAHDRARGRRARHRPDRANSARSSRRDRDAPRAEGTPHHRPGVFAVTLRN